MFSDSSIASAASFSRSVYYQDQVQAAYTDQKAPGLSHSKSDISDPNSGYQRERIQDPNYTVVPTQMDQTQQIQQHQQFIPANTQYIPHQTTATGQVPIPSYYQVYTTPSQQQQIPHPINQQYPVYVMPVGHAQVQPYNVTTLQPDPNVIPSSRPLISAQSVAGTPPVYPTRPATPSMPTHGNQAFVQIPSGQYQQQQFVGIPQIHHHQPQSLAVSASSAASPPVHVPSTASNYGYEYGAPAQEQAYYMQQQKNTNALPSHYQSMTPAAAAAVLSDASKQFPAESIQQQNRTTPQPL